MHVDHLYGGKFLKHAARGQTGSECPQPLTQSHLQAIGQEGDKDVRLDAFLELMEDRPNAKLILEAFERLLDILFVMPLRIDWTGAPILGREALRELVRWLRSRDDPDRSSGLADLAGGPAKRGASRSCQDSAAREPARDRGRETRS